MTQSHTFLPNLVQVELLYPIAAIETIGSKSTFGMINFFVS